MSYNDSYRAESGSSYQRPSEAAEYGGGGRGSDNYYDQSNRYDDNENRQGREHLGGEGGYSKKSGDYGSDAGRGYGENQQGSGYVGGYGSGGYGDGSAVAGYGGSDSEPTGPFSSVLHHATHHADSSTSSSLFDSALSFLNQNHGSLAQDTDVNEEQVVSAHQTMYGAQNQDQQQAQQAQQQQQQHSAETVGVGAAMQALKLFTSQGGGHGEGGGLGGGVGGGQNQFIGMAMAQAGKLFDEKQGQGTVVSFLSVCLLIFWSESRAMVGNI